MPPLKLRYPPSESLWKSVVVKSIRIGWPAGIVAGERHLGRSETKRLLMVQLFEDIWPHESELQEARGLVAAGDYAALCEFDTHHGQGLTLKAHALGDKADYIAENDPDSIVAEAKQYSLWLQKRGYQDFWLWLQLKHELQPLRRRPIDPAPFTGVPAPMADGHCKEGRILGQKDTILSGSWTGHVNLCKVVQAKGWGYVHMRVHESPLVWDEEVHSQSGLFE